MTREDLLDASVYGCVNASPTISAAGIHHTFRGFTLEEIEAALNRLHARSLVAWEVDGGRATWSIVVAT